MEIVTEPTFQLITWVIRGFFELPQNKEFFLDSPNFLFSGDPYCMRLYPNGHGDVTAFHVRRLSGNSPEREVSYAIGLRRRMENGDESYLYYPRSLQENVSYSRSMIEEVRDESVPDGNLTIVCTISREGSSGQGEEEHGGFSGHCASLSSRQSSAKMELTTQFPCTHVELFVRNVFELLRDTGNSLTSPEFRFAGDTYCFQLEENGDTGDIDLRLVTMTSTFTENTIYYRVGRGFNDRPIYSNNLRPLVGNSGFSVSLSTLETERVKYLVDGDLSIVLFLSLFEQTSAGAGTSFAVQKGTGLTDIEKFQSDRTGLLQKETESDICFVVRGKEFRVHRNVLRARSKVFEAMFGHDTDEKGSGRMVVDDLDTVTFGDFIEYLYNGNVRSGLSDDNAFGLYVAANRYAVFTLKAKCLGHIRRTLSVDSFCDVLTLALRYREDDLLQKAIKFFKDNLQSIIVTAKWQQFVLDNGAAANELFVKALVPGK